MTEITNEKLRALVERSTPGPWKAKGRTVYHASYGEVAFAQPNDYRGAPEPTAVLIALAPSLAAEVLALREERERLRGALALTDKALRPAVVQAAGGPRIAEIGAWLATADDAIGLIEAALAEPQS
jgi:hypothetical protein